MPQHSTGPACADWFRRRGALLLATAILAASCVGCGGDSSMGSVRGKVTHNGQPVAGGSLQFQPVSGGKGPSARSAAATVESDGTYELTTSQPGDGAAVGKHRVIYVAPVPQFSSSQEAAKAKGKKAPYEGLVPKPSEVDVKPGSNTIDIELVAR